jgi:23S rRNA G2445 N2-methylase RlmL
MFPRRQLHDRGHRQRRAAAGLAALAAAVALTAPWPGAAEHAHP